MVKRAIDILLSCIALFFLWPVLLVIAMLVMLTSAGGPFFRQIRVGRLGRTFHLLKFRTMRIGSEALGQITVGGRDPRITRVGYILRKSKLDELPQLINVLMGHMSIVGPRPEVPKYVALYTEEQRQVLTLRPGLTSAASLAYVNENEILGKSPHPERTYTEVVMPAKLAMDITYVREQSLWLDLRIILGTARKLLVG